MMRWILGIFLLTGVALAQSQSPSPQQNNPANAPTQTQTDQRGSEQMPLFVQTIQAPKSAEERRQDSKDREDKAELERETIWLSGLTLLVLALQFAAFVYQAMKLRETVKAMGGQSIDMKNSVAEAARAASAMEQVAAQIEKSANSAAESVELTRTRWTQQMRAYVTVSISDGLYQDRPNNIRFAVLSAVSNTGQTPAHNLRYRARAAIFPHPLPEEVTLEVPQNTPWIGSTVLGPHQAVSVSAAVESYIPDAEVANVKFGTDRRVYIWGTVAYEDVTGVTRETDFSQSIYWLSNGKIMGNYERRSRAT